MKARLIIFLTILVGIATAARNPETADNSNGTEGSRNMTASAPAAKDVTINGVVWAGCNVAEPGKLAANPTDYGCLYQWNCIKAWPSDDSKPDNWPAPIETGDRWEGNNDPCPEGYRVPTDEDMDKLFETNVVNEWTTSDGVTGRMFTDKTTNVSIFFPAAGARGHKSGVLTYASLCGYYWTATSYPGDTEAGNMVLTERYAMMNNFIRSLGCSIRCVRK